MYSSKNIYKRRFGKDRVFRDRMYKVLCRDFFQKYISPESTVLDLAAGYCEFINNIKARTRMAVDINPSLCRFAGKGVKAIVSTSTNLNKIKSGSVDCVFVSNFFEHITKEDIIRTIAEIRRVLKKGGKFLILQPNIRYCFRDYWMFFDHITPLDDRSITEVLELNGFRIIESKPKFLPYTTKGRLPKSLFLLRIYLKVKILHRIFGKQAFIIAKKE